MRKICLLLLIALSGQSRAQGRIAFEFMNHRDTDLLRARNSEIFAIDADGTNLVNLTNHPAQDRSPSWSPDGRQIAFQSDRGPGGQIDIYVVDVDGNNVVNLTNSAATEGAPAWSPDGRQIAFSLSSGDARSSSVDIYVMDVDGNISTKLTDIGGFCGFPSWSSAGGKTTVIRGVSWRWLKEGRR